MSLISVEEAKRLILQKVSPLEAERIAVDDALGRVLYGSIHAIRTLPEVDTSAMDGYAMRGDDANRVGNRLTVLETIYAGQRPHLPIEAGQCARIMTGASVPLGADTVVMQEKTRAMPDGTVELIEATTPAANVRQIGDDVHAGAEILPAGTQLGISDLSLLWSQGIDHVQVHRRPRVAIVSSGDELVEVGRPHGNKTYDSNSPTLALMVHRTGGLARRLGIAGDTLESVKEKIQAGLTNEFDVLICVAGMSVGERDYVREVLTQLGVQLEFTKVALKPGKPTAFGTRGKKFIFGLPGNPVSALVTFELFVRPALRKLQGIQTADPVQSAHLLKSLKKPGGLKLAARGTIEQTADGWVAIPLGSQSSASVASLRGATHLILVPDELSEAPSGQKVEVISVNWGPPT